MTIGILTICLHIPLTNSLKEKRRHLRSLKDRLAVHFNVSVAEVGDQDKWQRSTLAVVHVGVTEPVVNSVLSHILDFVENFPHLNVLNHEMEMIR